MVYVPSGWGSVRSLRLPSARCTLEKNRHNLRRFEAIHLRAFIEILRLFPAFSDPPLIQ